MAELIATNLSKRYGEREVVRHINVSIRDREVVGLLGPNGAGKTTTFYMLVGVINPTTGQVFLDGQEVTDRPLHERARLGLSYLPQESSIFKKLSVRKNLDVILEQTPMSFAQRDARAKELLEDYTTSRSDQ